MAREDAALRYSPLRSFGPALLDLIAARECGGCGAPAGLRSPLCAPCRHTLTSTADQPPRRALLAARGAPRTHAVTYYEDPLRTMLIEYKERGRCDLRELLAVALAGAVAAAAGLDARSGPRSAGQAGDRRCPAEATLPLRLVPMPSTRAAVRTRGLDTTAHLTRATARVLRVAGVPEVRGQQFLRHRRRVADQAGLTRAERAANLAGALHVPPRRRPALAGVRVVLVDDIATSGATLAEAARAVREAGGRVVGAAVVAAARLAR